MSSSGKPGAKVTGLVFSPWNLLLLVPLIVLITPIYNRERPEFIGMPFFYWFQFAVIVLGVICTVLVYRMTRNKPASRARRAATDVDDLDEGNAG
jgi:uncharacterized membrane protein